ncbi:flagellar biosynthesis anti-sigma factor FlgM [Candidatus Omnitrophota bacterium]
MPVNQIPGDANIDAVKRQQMQLLKQASKNEGTEQKTTEGDTVEISQMAKDIIKFKEKLESIPEPNEGRIEELQQAIKDGTLLNDESIEGASSAIANVLI